MIEAAEDTAMHGISGAVIASAWWLRERRRSRKDAYDVLLEQIRDLRGKIDKLEEKLDAMREENVELRLALISRGGPLEADSSQAQDA